MQTLKPEWEQRRSEKLAFSCGRLLSAHGLISFFEGVSSLGPFFTTRAGRETRKIKWVRRRRVTREWKGILAERKDDLEKNGGS